MIITSALRVLLVHTSVSTSFILSEMVQAAFRLGLGLFGGPAV